MISNDVVRWLTVVGIVAMKMSLPLDLLLPFLRSPYMPLVFFIPRCDDFCRGYCSSCGCHCYAITVSFVRSFISVFVLLFVSFYMQAL